MSNIEKTLIDLNKKFGKGSVIVLGDAQPITTNLLSTGSLLIDSILGGGIGYGRITEIYGVESSGKSTLCLHLAAECQKGGGTVAYIDVEHALDPVYAKHLGVDISKLVFTQPNSGEQALEIAEALIKSGEINLIVVDSVAALVPQAELDGEMSDVNIGLLARLMSKCMRKLTGALNDKNCAMVFINQIREKVSTGFSTGPSETTTGGRALKFYASQRIELRKTTAIKSGDKVIGNNVKVKIVKNKIAPPMKTCEVPLIFGEGFSSSDEVIDLGIDCDLIQKSGGWYTAHDGQRFQGKDAVKTYYKNNQDKEEELREKVKQKLFNSNPFEEEPTDLSDEEIAKIIVDEETGEVKGY